MTKKELIEDPNSCLNRAADDEPVFLLRSNDEIMNYAVMEWIKQSIDHGQHFDKITSALKLMEVSKRWHIKHCAECSMIEMRGSLIDRLHNALQDETDNDSADILAGRKTKKIFDH